MKEFIKDYQTFLGYLSIAIAIVIVGILLSSAIRYGFSSLHAALISW